jgi:glycine/D-amino acid oxidase-like deaminating enzyme
MFIDTSDSRTVRRHLLDGQEILLVGGEGHKTGQGGDTDARYQRIEEWARRHFPVKTILHRWATQDYATPDRIPYIGRLTPTSRHMYVATGFKGWGMSSAPPPA